MDTPPCQPSYQVGCALTHSESLPDTNIGIDDRNTFDMIRSMPGGLAGVRGLVDDFHQAGVKVLLPYHPWDLTTRREACGDSGAASVSALSCTPGQPLDDASAAAAIVVATGADGFNGDTMSQFDPAFYYRLTEVTGRPLALQPEMGFSTQMLAWSTLTWAENWNYSPAQTWQPEKDLWPMISTNKWVSKGSYMVQLTERWLQNKAIMAATAFFVSGCVNLLHLYVYICSRYVCGSASL